MPLANFKCFLPNLRVRNVTKKVALNILTLLSVFANDGKTVLVCFINIVHDCGSQTTFRNSVSVQTL